MIYMKRGRWMFRDESGKLHKFNTQEEAAKATGLVMEKDYAEEEEDYLEEENSNETPNYGWQIETKEEVDTEE